MQPGRARAHSPAIGAIRIILAVGPLLHRIVGDGAFAFAFARQVPGGSGTVTFYPRNTTWQLNAYTAANNIDTVRRGPGQTPRHGGVGGGLVVFHPLVPCPSPCNSV